MALVKVVKQRFDGYVTGYSKSQISARITDTTNAESAEECVLFSSNVIPTKQRRNIYAGARFDIEIGTLYGAKHFKKPFFRINLGGISWWTQMQIDEAKRQAAELCELL